MLVRSWGPVRSLDAIRYSQGSPHVCCDMHVFAYFPMCQSIVMFLSDCLFTGAGKRFVQAVLLDGWCSPLTVEAKQVCPQHPDVSAQPNY
jgi:hypothetical protein